MTDAERLHLAAREVAADHPLMARQIRWPGDVRPPEAAAWEAALALIVAELVIALIRECRKDRPEAVRRRAARLMGRPWWHLLHHIEYARLWRIAGSRFDAHAPAAYGDDDITTLLDSVLARAAAADDQLIEACRGAALA